MSPYPIQEQPLTQPAVRQQSGDNNTTLYVMNQNPIVVGAGLGFTIGCLAGDGIKGYVIGLVAGSCFRLFCSKAVHERNIVQVHDRTE